MIDFGNLNLVSNSWIKKEEKCRAKKKKSSKNKAPEFVVKKKKWITDVGNTSELWVLITHLPTYSLIYPPNHKIYSSGIVGFFQARWRISMSFWCKEKKYESAKTYVYKMTFPKATLVNIWTKKKNSMIESK